MSAPVISGSALAETRLDKIRARVAHSDRDELYAPAYGDRRYLLGLVDEMAEALAQLQYAMRAYPAASGDIHVETALSVSSAVLAKAAL